MWLFIFSKILWALQTNWSCFFFYYLVLQLFLLEWISWKTVQICYYKEDCYQTNPNSTQLAHEICEQDHSYRSIQIGWLQKHEKTTTLELALSISLEIHSGLFPENIEIVSKTFSIRSYNVQQNDTTNLAKFLLSDNWKVYLEKNWVSSTFQNYFTSWIVLSFEENNIQCFVVGLERFIIFDAVFWR